MRSSPAARPWRRRRASLQTWVALGVVVLGAVALVVLWKTGVISRATFGAATTPSTRGLVAVPMTPRAIPAYTRVTRDDFWDPAGKRLTVTYLPPQAVTPDLLTKWSDIWGRVLDHDKPAGYVFTEADFLPKGTRAGLVAGIPAGKRALRVQADKVTGLYGLQRGDHLDLVATLPIDVKGRAQSFGFAGAYAQQLALQAQLTNWQKQATVRVMAQNAVVVEPLTTRQVPVYSSTLTQGAVTRLRPVQEVVIAVDPGDVARLTEALAVDAQISAVPRSGRPDDPAASVTPDLDPVSPFGGPGVAPGAGAAGLTMVEAIAGSKRELTAVVAK
jgi:Flp pilus assembly protein CpaB